MGVIDDKNNADANPLTLTPLEFQSALHQALTNALSTPDGFNFYPGSPSLGNRQIYGGKPFAPDYKTEQSRGTLEDAGYYPPESRLDQQDTQYKRRDDILSGKVRN